MKYFQLITSFSLLLLLITAGSASAQNPDNQQVCVKNTTGETLKFPWAGGMNSCQYGMLDINLDGIKDLVVFDRTGNRILPFLYDGDTGLQGYTFAPEYIASFPSLSDWAIFVDYNNDGKEDIFTYSPGYAGLKVYRNVSVDELEFRLQVFPYLTSFQGGGYVNILVTNVDYPGIYDLDGDGDLDMLTFYGLGSFVEMHLNMSMEKYGHSDSLDFIRTSYCWGFFAESEESNDLTLDTCLGGRAWEEQRHTGSSFRLMDLNGDGLVDLLLGDVDYPNLVALYNGGTADTARITSYDWEYPAGDHPVRLFSLPAAYYGDIDGDGLEDLLVSPFDPNPFIVENQYSSWLYKNYGSADHPQFARLTRSFLQEEMIDVGAGAYPVFFDYDHDGLLDLFIANYGYYDTSYYDEFLTLYTEHTGQLALLRNTGTAQHPSFTWVDRDFAGISSLGLRGGIPAFGDLDGDGDADMLIGREDGKLVVFYNVAGPGDPMQLEFGGLMYQDVDVGSYSAPQLFDLDNDGLLDLVIGERAGNLNLYRNTGTPQQPEFTFETDSLGKINVTDLNVSLNGYSVPFFYRDAQNQIHLLVGSEQGEIFYFTGIDGLNFTDPFERNDTLAGLIGMESLVTGRGYRTAATLADLNGDGVPEMIVGNFSGGLEYFGIPSAPTVNSISDPGFVADLLRIYPNPASEMLMISIDEPFEILQVALLDLSGRVVAASGKSNANILKINIADLFDGMYIIQMTLRHKPSGKTFINREKMLKIS